MTFDLVFELQVSAELTASLKSAVSTNLTMLEARKRSSDQSVYTGETGVCVCVHACVCVCVCMRVCVCLCVCVCVLIFPTCV